MIDMARSLTVFFCKKNNDEHLEVTTSSPVVVKLASEWIGSETGDLILHPGDTTNYLTDISKLILELFSKTEELNEEDIDILQALSTVHQSLRTIKPKNVVFSHYHLNLG